MFDLDSLDTPDVTVSVSLSALGLACRCRPMCAASARSDCRIALGWEAAVGVRVGVVAVAGGAGGIGNEAVPAGMNMPYT